MACAPSTREVNGELIKFTINRSEIEFAMKQGLEEVVHAEPEVMVFSIIKIFSRKIIIVF